MTKFIYLADTHVGAENAGYHQQPAYRERIPEIIDALGKWISGNGGVDFILHGGDIVDSASPANIETARDLFAKLPAPTYLCMGNHDLTTRTALDDWLRLAPEFFPSGFPESAITMDDCAIHIAPCHWCDILYHWNINTQDPHFDPKQLSNLEKNLRGNDGKPQILLTHNPVFGLPPEQTGLDEPLHAPAPTFTKTIMDIIKPHPSVKMVLGAHNHMNMNLEYRGTVFVTASSLTETPFEFKQITSSENKIEMTTISLEADLPFKAEYDFSKSYIQYRGKITTL